MQIPYSAWNSPGILAWAQGDVVEKLAAVPLQPGGGRALRRVNSEHESEWLHGDVRGGCALTLTLGLVHR